MNDFIEFIKNRRKMNLAIVLINIAVYIVTECLGNTEDASYMLKCGAAYTPYILDGEYWRLITAMFLHFGFRHLLYNMISLLFLGDILETVVGPVRYVLIYLIGGIAGNVVSMLWTMNRTEIVVSAGASGGIMAVTGAIACIAVRNRRILGENSTKRLMLMVVLMIMQGVIEKGVDNAAHLGGLAAGALLAVLLWRVPGRQRKKDM